MPLRIFAALALCRDHRHTPPWESDGRGTRQSGQILTEAATTNSLRVVRLLLFANDSLGARLLATANKLAYGLGKFIRVARAAQIAGAERWIV